MFIKPIKVLEILIGSYKVKIDIFYLSSKCINNTMNSFKRCVLKINVFTGPAIMPIDSKRLSWRYSKPKDDVQLSWSKILICEITLRQDKTRFVKDELFRIVIIIMYITHSTLYLVNFDLINFYEFATNRYSNRSSSGAHWS